MKDRYGMIALLGTLVLGVGILLCCSMKCMKVKNKRACKDKSKVIEEQEGVVVEDIID